jgi:hypothetical protein
VLALALLSKRLLRHAGVTARPAFRVVNVVNVLALRDGAVLILTSLAFSYAFLITARKHAHEELVPPGCH